MKLMFEEQNIYMRLSNLDKQLFTHCVLNQYSNRQISKILNKSYYQILRYKRELAIYLYNKGVSLDIIGTKLRISMPYQFIHTFKTKKNNIINNTNEIKNTNEINNNNNSNKNIYSSDNSTDINEITEKIQNINIKKDNFNFNKFLYELNNIQ